MNPSIIKVDIDKKPFNRRSFDHKVMMLAKELEAKDAIVHLWSTKRGTHAIIHIGRIVFKPEIIVACQLFLGSDPARELFNIGRIHRREFLGWNVLFKAKWKKGKLVGKEYNHRSYIIKIGSVKK